MPWSLIVCSRGLLDTLTLTEANRLVSTVAPHGATRPQPAISMSELDEFVEQPLPEYKPAVYVLYFSLPNSAVRIPFYVGQTDSIPSRIGDYLRANFNAPTDFKVGEAIKLLRERGCDVFIRFKYTEYRRPAEKDLINKLGADYHLLNKLNGYRYETADKQEQRIKISDFVEKMLAVASASVVSES